MNIFVPILNTPDGSVVSFVDMILSVSSDLRSAKASTRNPCIGFPSNSRVCNLSNPRNARLLIPFISLSPTCVENIVFETITKYQVIITKK